MRKGANQMNEDRSCKNCGNKMCGMIGKDDLPVKCWGNITNKLFPHWQPQEPAKEPEVRERGIKVDKNDIPELSNCCNAPIKVDGDDTEGTHYYVCTKCNNPCDVARPEAKEGWEERLINEFRIVSQSCYGDRCKDCPGENKIDKCSDARKVAFIIDKIRQARIEAVEPYRKILEEFIKIFKENNNTCSGKNKIFDEPYLNAVRLLKQQALKKIRGK